MTWGPAPIHGSGNQDEVVVCPLVGAGAPSTDPSDIVIAAGDVQGVLRTINSTKTADTGQTWAASNRHIGNTQYQYRVNSVYWHPTWAGICFATTGDVQGGNGVDQGGLLVSCDYGASFWMSGRDNVWTDTGTGFPRPVGRCIQADSTGGPNGTGYIYVGCYKQGVWRCPNPATKPTTSDAMITAYDSGWVNIWAGSSTPAATGFVISAMWAQDNGSSLWVCTTDVTGTPSNANSRFIVRINNRKGTAPWTSAVANADIDIFTGTNAPVNTQDVIMLPHTAGGAQQDLYVSARDNSGAGHIRLLPSADAATGAGATWTNVHAGNTQNLPSIGYMSLDGFFDAGTSYLFVLCNGNEPVVSTIHQHVWRGKSSNFFATQAGRDWAPMNVAYTGARNFSGSNTLDDVSGFNLTGQQKNSGLITSWIGATNIGLVQNISCDPNDHSVLYISGGSSTWKCKGANAATINGTNVQWFPHMRNMPVVQTYPVWADPKRWDRALALYTDRAAIALTRSTETGPWQALLRNRDTGGGTIAAGTTGVAACFDPRTAPGSASHTWMSISTRNAGFSTVAGETELFHCADWVGVTNCWSPNKLNGTAIMNAANGYPGPNNMVVALMAVEDDAGDLWLLAALARGTTVADHGIYKMNWTNSGAWTLMGGSGAILDNLTPPTAWLRHIPGHDYFYCYSPSSGLWKFPRTNMTGGSWTRVVAALSNDVRWGHMILNPRNANDANDCCFITCKNGGAGSMTRGLYRVSSIRGTDTGTGTRLIQTATADRPGPIAIFEHDIASSQRLHLINKSNNGDLNFGAIYDHPGHYSCSLDDAITQSASTPIDWTYHSGSGDEPDFFGENHFGEPNALTCMSYNNNGTLLVSNQFNAVQIWAPSSAVSPHKSLFDTANSTASGTTLTIPAPADGIPALNRVALMVHTASTGATLPTATDSGSNVYTVVHAQTNTVSSLNTWVVSSVLASPLDPGDSITVTTNSNSDRRAYAFDLGPGLPDVLAHTGTTSAATTAPTSTTVAIAEARASMLGSCNYGSTSTEFTPAGGWTVDDPSINELLVGDANRAEVDRQVVNTAGSYAFNGVLTSSRAATTTLVAFGTATPSTVYFATTATNSTVNLVLTVPTGATIAANRRVAVVASCGGQATGISVTDSGGNLYLLDRALEDAGGNMNVAIASSVLGTALSAGNSISVSFTGASAGAQRRAYAYDLGTGLPDPLAGSSHTSTNTTAVTSSAATFTTSGSTAVAIGSARYASASASFTSGGSWVEDGDLVSGVATSAFHTVDRQTALATGSLNFTGTISSATYAGSVIQVYGQTPAGSTAWLLANANSSSLDIDLTLTAGQSIAAGRRVAIVAGCGGGVTNMTVADEKNGTWTSPVTLNGAVAVDSTASQTVLIGSTVLGTALTVGDSITVAFTGSGPGASRAAVLYDIGPGVPNRVGTAAGTAPSTLHPQSGEATFITAPGTTMVILGATKYNSATDIFAPDPPFSDDGGIVAGAPGTVAHLDVGRLLGAGNNTYNFTGLLSSGLGWNSGSAMVAWGTTFVANPANEVTIGVTRTQLPSSAGVAYLFSTPRSNTGTIWIGNSTLAQPTTGVFFDLKPGRAVRLVGSNESLFYAQSDVAAQTLHIATIGTQLVEQG